MACLYFEKLRLILNVQNEQSTLTVSTNEFRWLITLRFLGPLEPARLIVLGGCEATPTKVSLKKNKKHRVYGALCVSLSSLPVCVDNRAEETRALVAPPLRLFRLLSKCTWVQLGVK